MSNYLEHLRQIEIAKAKRKNDRRTSEYNTYDINPREYGMKVNYSNLVWDLVIEELL